MSEKMRRALEATVTAVEQNKPAIEHKLSEAGVEISAAVLCSAAKYYEALEKLAKE